LYDRAFVGNHAFGLTDWSSEDGKDHKGFKTLLLEKYSPEIVSGITGLDSKEIITLAREFARAKAPIALCGKGKGVLNGSVLEFMAVQSLNALVGNINQPGGVLVHDPLPLSPWPRPERDTFAQQGLKRTLGDRPESMRSLFKHSLTIDDMATAVIEGPRSPIDTLLIFSSNPAYSLPDGGAFREALKKIPYIVSFSPYKDESSFMADLVLPDHNYLEKTDDIVWPAGLQYPLYGLSQPVVEPIYDTTHSGDVVIRLARLIGGTVGASFPWKNFEESLKARAKGLFESKGGLTDYDESVPVWKGFASRSRVRSDYRSFDEMWKKIKSGGLWYRPTHNFGNWRKLFKTPTGRFEFYSSRLELALQGLALDGLGLGVEGDEALMPHYEPARSPADKKAYPLVMMPYELINLSSGWLPNPPYLNKTLFDHQLRKNESFIEINPKTAGQYNLTEGNRVIIQSRKGRLQARVHLFEGAMPGVVYVPLGFGHTAYDDYQKGKGVNPNEIIDGGKDLLSGEKAWWDTRVKLIKV
jgi:anaerobic selenocysteine-containing dehydrogenase